MNIKFDSLVNSSFSLLPSMSQYYKPIIYLITTIALGILMVSFYRYASHSSELRAERVKTFASQEEKRKEEQLIEKLIKNSTLFASRISFPTHQNLIKSFAVTPQLQAEVVEHAMTTRPVLSAHIWSFIPHFLDYKKQYGSEIEKKLYQEMTPEQFVDRLIKKRPLMFMTEKDSYILRNGQQGAGGFEQIGTDEENGELCLENYQSYFEMRLAAFIELFVPTHFINTGSRKNEGKIAPEGTYETQGIYVGMVGARFEKPGLMEWSHMIVTPEQNHPLNGYGSAADPQDPKTLELRLWAKLYNSRIGEEYTFPTYEEAAKDPSGRFMSIEGGKYLDTYVYKQRLSLVIESFLLEANQRAEQQGKKAYLHIVGLGLGVWMVDPRQKNLMLEVYAELLQKHPFTHISDLNFSWFGPSHPCGKVGDQGFFDCHGQAIKIHFSQRDPAEKLKGEDEGKLLIAQYAWDANSYPGNEYWAKMLTASGDPAAACCSTIPELQNPEINPYVQAHYLTLKPSKGRVKN